MLIFFFVLSPLVQPTVEIHSEVLKIENCIPKLK